MEKAAQRKTSKYEALDVLADIRSRNTGFATGEVESFAPVYYPIAIVEMRLEEQTFEDFETVHLTILRLIAMGITDYKIIAQTLGLSPNYVFKILRILTGYGHITDSGLTDLGRRSLTEEKKITTTQTRQRFQVDALEGELLKVEELVTDSMLNSREETRLTIGHLDHLDGMDVNKLKEQLTGSNGKDYFHRKSGILHANVVGITDVRCVEIKFAKCYLLKMKKDPRLYVFAKLYNKKAKEVKDRFSWSQFCSRDLRRYDLGNSVHGGTQQIDDHLVRLYAMMIEQCGKVDFSQEVPKAVSRVYPFRESGITVLPARREVWIDEEAISQYRKQLLHILCDLHSDGQYLITNEFLYGQVVTVKTDSAGVRALAQVAAEKIRAHGISEIAQKLREHFGEREETGSIVTEMTQLLQSL